MRKLRIMEHVSLDGVIEIGAPGGGGNLPYGDWTAPYRSPAGAAHVLEMYGENFDLLLGRRTYDAWSGYWPTTSGPMADRLNAATKHVVTHRPESLQWGPFEGIGPDIVAAVREVRAKGDRDLVVSGSSTLTSVLLEHGLVDEMILLVNPVLLGKGKRLLAEGTPPRAFVPAGTRALPTGIVVNTYTFVGPLQNPAA